MVSYYIFQTKEAKDEKIGYKEKYIGYLYIYIPQKKRRKVLRFNICALVECNLKHFSVSNATNSTNIDFYQQKQRRWQKIYNKKGNRKYLRNKRTLISYYCSSYRICHLTLLKW